MDDKDDFNDSDLLNDDNMDLPDYDYQPLDSNEDSGFQSGNDYQNDRYGNDAGGGYVPGSYVPPDDENNAGKIIAIVIIILLFVGGGGAGWYFGYYKPQQEKEKAKIALEKKKKDEEKRQAALREAEARKRAEQERLALEETKEEEPESQSVQSSSPQPGTIETLSSRTGKHYVILSCSIDGDLAMDYAKKLAKSGKGVTVIPPLGISMYYKVSTENFETQSDAESKVELLRNEFGPGIWVQKF